MVLHNKFSSWYEQRRHLNETSHSDSKSPTHEEADLHPDFTVNEAPSFNLLPRELVIHVLGFIGQSRDQKNARLVCRTWSNTVMPLLFEELRLAPATIYRLQDKKILQMVHLHVKHLILYCSTSHIYCTEHSRFNNWQKGLREYLASPRAWDAPRNARFDSRLRHICDEQTFINQFMNPLQGTHGKLWTAFTHALRSFRRLTKTTLGDREWFGDMGEKSRSSMERCVNWRVIECEYLRKDWWIARKDCFVHDFLDEVLRVLDASQIRITHLSTGDIPLQSFNMSAFSMVKHIIDLPKSLKVISLQVAGQRIFPDNEIFTGHQIKQLSAFLSAVTQLQELSLSLATPNFWTDSYGDYRNTDFLEHLSLAARRLRRLALSNMAFTFKSVQSILKSHRDTLTSLELQDVRLIDDDPFPGFGGWGSILQTLASDLNLQHVSLVGLAADDTWVPYFDHGKSLNARAMKLESALHERVLRGEDIQMLWHELVSRHTKPNDFLF